MLMHIMHSISTITNKLLRLVQGKSPMRRRPHIELHCDVPGIWSKFQCPEILIDSSQAHLLPGVQVRADIEALKEYGANELVFPTATHPPSHAKRKQPRSSAAGNGSRSSKAVSSGGNGSMASVGGGSSADASSGAVSSTATAVDPGGDSSSDSSDSEAEGSRDLVTLKAMQWAAATLLSRSFYLTLPLPGASGAHTASLQGRPLVSVSKCAHLWCLAVHLQHPCTSGIAPD